jgi:hypothetical protein
MCGQDYLSVTSRHNEITSSTVVFKNSSMMLCSLLAA